MAIALRHPNAYAALADDFGASGRLNGRPGFLTSAPNIATLFEISDKQVSTRLREAAKKLRSLPPQLAALLDDDNPDTMNGQAWLRRLMRQAATMVMQLYLPIPKPDTRFFHGATTERNQKKLDQNKTAKPTPTILNANRKGGPVSPGGGIAGAFRAIGGWISGGLVLVPGGPPGKPTYQIGGKKPEPEPT